MNFEAMCIIFMFFYFEQVENQEQKDQSSVVLLWHDTPGKLLGMRRQAERVRRP